MSKATVRSVRARTNLATWSVPQFRLGQVHGGLGYRVTGCRECGKAALSATWLGDATAERGLGGLLYRWGIRTQWCALTGITGWGGEIENIGRAVGPAAFQNLPSVPSTFTLVSAVTPVITTPYSDERNGTPERSRGHTRALPKLSPSTAGKGQGVCARLFGVSGSQESC